MFTLLFLFLILSLVLSFNPFLLPSGRVLLPSFMLTDPSSVSSYCPFCFVLLLFKAGPVAYGSSQARGWIRAAADGHSHSNARSELHLPPIPQFIATPDPWARDQICILMDTMFGTLPTEPQWKFPRWHFFYLFYFLFIFIFCLFKAAPMAYGVFQPEG